MITALLRVHLKRHKRTCQLCFRTQISAPFNDHSVSAKFVPELVFYIMATSSLLVHLLNIEFLSCVHKKIVK